MRGTEHVTGAALSEGVSRLVYCSTLGVHGYVARGTLDETSAVRPNTPYRYTKWLGEIAVREAHRRSELPVVVARISTVVGPGATNWVPFVKAAHAGRLRLIGNGTNHMDLVAVDDLVDGLWRCTVVPKANGCCYVLGSGELWTTRAFVHAVARVLQVAVPDRGFPAMPYRALLQLASVVFRTTGYFWPFPHNREALVANKTASSARARTDIGYEPNSSVEAAIGAMIDQFRANGSLSASHAQCAVGT